MTAVHSFRIAEDVVRRNAVDPDFLAPEQKDVAPAGLIENLRDELPTRMAQEAVDLVVCHGDACLPNFMVDPSRHECTGLIDPGRLGGADRYVDLSLLIANSAETWADRDVAAEAFETSCAPTASPPPTSTVSGSTVTSIP